MKMLYIGPLNEGGTCLDRMRALQDLGVEIVPFDILRFDSPLRIVNSLAHRLGAGPPVWGLNRSLAERAAALDAGLDVAYVDKGVWIGSETLRAIRRATGAVLVHFTPDPALLFHSTRHFLRSLPLYDLCVTTKPWEVELYRRHGARRVYLTHQAFERARFAPGPADPLLASDVLFVGHYEPAYAAPVRVAVETGARVKVWGRGWPRYARLHRWAGRAVQGDGIWRDDYARAIRSAAIGLGLLSKCVPETSTTRSFEIPACGTFLLGERTDEHSGFFSEGSEAEFFGSKDELRRKITYYLERPDERRRVAAAGRERALRSGYSNHDRMRDVVREISEIAGERAARPARPDA